ncbi:hypothetical protein CVV70_17390 [Ralstonia solanacearum]|nr:hypothetical protein CVS51_18280 [Ralstonia solanacearum]PNQ39001.1 hypothetical protein CVV71_05135 [Ralstonia solanacearum]PNQ40209.1 hypothetical protein CVT21_14935 [Ralstonia solanacearum]PNQ41094.1 hypothetical protein CVT22_17250 [Ralstonia solanacearum]PNQ47919.1 hypothetical protein CVV70_17390 [Ralstonia solanacearum]
MAPPSRPRSASAKNACAPNWPPGSSKASDPALADPAAAIRRTIEAVRRIESGRIIAGLQRVGRLPAVPALRSDRLPPA